MEVHKPVKTKKFSFTYCKRCGLVYLNNRVSQWAIKQGCDYTEHPKYKQELHLSVLEKSR